MIEIGKVVFHDHHWTDRDGYFVIEAESNTPGFLIGRRIMKRDGTIIKASKLRPRLDVIKMTLVDGATVQKRYDDHMNRARNVAETELHYLMKFVG